MKKYLLLLLMSALTFSVKAQHYLYPSAHPKFITATNDTLPFPFAGGLLTPQFSNIDLNFNGILDLFVFDPETNKILTFVNDGNQHTPRFYYAPHYEEFFPDDLIEFVLLHDYNNDGKPDIFTYSRGGGLKVYRNTSVNGTLSFELLYEKLQVHYPTYVTNLTITPNNMPAFADVNGNGKMDILGYDLSGYKAEFYKNISEHPDSLKFRVEDLCWGKFYKTSDPSQRFIPNYSCWNLIWKMHPGSNMLVLDIDGDGDMDIIAGDASYNHLTLLVNGKANYNHPVDSIINIVPNYPPSKPVDIKTFPAAFYVDVNNDGKRDLIASAYNELSESATLDQVWLYMNNGQDNHPDFVFKQTNFLQDGMIDHGSHAAPALFDYTGNGLPDLFISAKGNRAITGDSTDRIYYYRNLGTQGFPVFKLMNDDFLNISNMHLKGLTIAFGDLTGNGSTDMLLGNSNGNLIFYKNLAAPNQQANFNLETTLYHNINVGEYSAPAIFDLNGNDKNDLLVGNKKGNVHFYRNAGTSAAPLYVLESDSFGGMFASADFWQYYTDFQGNIIDSSYHHEPGFAAPVVTDLNKDGKLEILLGSKWGEVKIYTGIEGNLNGNFIKVDTVFYDYGHEKGMNRIFDMYTKPAVAYLNNDTFPDVIIGINRGGIIFYGSIDEGTGIPPLSAAKQSRRSVNVRMFPNPASFELNFLFDQKLPGQNVIQLFDLTGRLMFQETFSDKIEYNLKLPELQGGIYLVRITGIENGVILNQKLVVK